MPELIGLPASPHQRLVCRVADGRELGPPLERISGYADEICERSGSAYMVGKVSSVQKPKELYVISGIRTFKSMVAMACALKGALTCDLSSLNSYEIPRVTVISLKLDLAGVLREHLAGYLASSRLLSAVRLGEPTADTVTVLHPSGRPVEIKVVAASKAGAAVISRWSAGVVIDEGPRFAGQTDGKVNFEDLKTASLGRLLPGAQFVVPGSPWAAYGPVYETVKEHWRRPTAERAVLRCSAPALNQIGRAHV